MDKKISKSSIGYRGEVTLQVKKGDKIFSSKTIHNNGRWPLFNFIAQCLAGKYGDAEMNRPKYIQLFEGGDKGTPVPVTITWTDTITASKIMFEGTPLAEYHQKNIPAGYAADQGVVIFEFLIPFSQIDTTKDLNLFALYDRQNYNGTNNPSAYFILSYNDGGTEKWDSLLEWTSGSKNEYNLFIQWKMIITDIDASV